jgi:hypothetical protein
MAATKINFDIIKRLMILLLSEIQPGSFRSLHPPAKQLPGWLSMCEYVGSCVVSFLNKFFIFKKRRQPSEQQIKPGVLSSLKTLIPLLQEKKKY